jgi:hypothetical protein
MAYQCEYHGNGECIKIVIGLFIRLSVLILADVSTVAPIDSADLWFRNKGQNYDSEA